MRYLQSTDDLLGKNKVLGVHVRLTDFKQNFLGHPVCITAEEHLKYAVDAVKKYGFNKIFWQQMTYQQLICLEKSLERICCIMKM